MVYTITKHPKTRPLLNQTDSMCPKSGWVQISDTYCEWFYTQLLSFMKSTLKRFCKLSSGLSLGIDENDDFYLTKRLGAMVETNTDEDRIWNENKK